MSDNTNFTAGEAQMTKPHLRLYTDGKLYLWRGKLYGWKCIGTIKNGSIYLAGSYYGTV